MSVGDFVNENLDRNDDGIVAASVVKRCVPP